MFASRFANGLMVVLLAALAMYGIAAAIAASMAKGFVHAEANKQARIVAVSTAAAAVQADFQRARATCQLISAGAERLACKREALRTLRQALADPRGKTKPGPSASVGAPTVNTHAAMANRAGALDLALYRAHRQSP